MASEARIEIPEVAPGAHATVVLNNGAAAFEETMRGTDTIDSFAKRLHAKIAAALNRDYSISWLVESSTLRLHCRYSWPTALGISWS
jgi:hypothetical protein